VRLGTILTDFSFASQRDPDQRIEGTSGVTAKRSGGVDQG